MRAGQAAPQSKNSVRLPEKTGRTNCGESGIRTHDTLLGYTHFPGAHLQPLGHFSMGIFALTFLVLPAFTCRLVC